MTRRAREDAYDFSRPPCPLTIIEETGVAFCIGAIGSTIWHGVKGFRNSPRGEGLRTAITGIKARAPVTAGNFASWGFLFSVGHCAIQGVRKKEDPWNSIIGASFASGALRARAGAKAIGAGALAGFIFMAVLEGVSIAIARRAAHHTRLEPPPPPQ